jgi:hypothetical protein
MHDTGALGFWKAIDEVFPGTKHSGVRFSSSLERRHAPVTSVHGVGRDMNWSNRLTREAK